MSHLASVGQELCLVVSSEDYTQYRLDKSLLNYGNLNLESSISGALYYLSSHPLRIFCLKILFI